MSRRSKKPPVLVPCEEHEWEDLAVTAHSMWLRNAKVGGWMCPGCFNTMQLSDERVACSTCNRAVEIPMN